MSFEYNKDIETMKKGNLDLNGKVRDITQIKGSTDFSVKDIGKALVFQNKAIIANISSMAESINGFNKTLNSLVVLKRAELQLRKEELIENKLYHKYMQLNTKDISKRLTGLGIAIDKMIISKHSDFKVLDELSIQEYIDRLDLEYKVYQKQLKNRLKRS